MKQPQKTPGQRKFEDMLKTRNMRQLLKSGAVLDVESARLRLDYSAWGLRRLCRRGKIGHINFLGHYYFLPEQIQAAFVVVAPGK